MSECVDVLWDRDDPVDEDLVASFTRWGEALLGATECLDRSLSVVLTDDDAIAGLNQQWRQVDGPTDVLSFPLHELEDALAHDLPFGEVVVSADTAIQQAAERGIPPSHELVLYVVHGVLHLLGYDDHDPAERRRMREAEARCLERAGVRRSLWVDEA